VLEVSKSFASGKGYSTCLNGLFRTATVDGAQGAQDNSERKKGIPISQFDSLRPRRMPNEILSSGLLDKGFKNHLRHLPNSMMDNDSG
jgi:hypothetical protein